MFLDARGFYRMGAGLSLTALLLVAVGFAFLSFMKMTLLARADLELHREIDSAMRMIAADAAEAESYQTDIVGDSVRVTFRKAREDASGKRVAMYATRRDGARTKLCKTRDSAGSQPITGESMLGDVTIVEFRAESLRPGCLHVVLQGKSRRTRQTYKATAEFVREAEK